MSYFKFKRFINYAYKIYNRIKLLTLGIKFGQNLCIHGHICIDKKDNAKIRFGDNVYISSGKHINPISRNAETSVRVEDNAVIEIGNNVGMSSVVLWSHNCIRIGDNVNIGANTVILDSDCHSLNYLDRRHIVEDLKYKNSAPIQIGDDVLIGMNCMVLKGVTIGNRSIIGAGSVVTRSIPSDCIAAGNPAIVIRKLN